MDGQNCSRIWKFKNKDELDDYLENYLLINDFLHIYQELRGLALPSGSSPIHSIGINSMAIELNVKP